jgi:hypothetical protein
MTLSPNYLPCIEDYLSKFKSLRILCIDYKIYLKEDRCIYMIISTLGSAYSVFVYNFYVTRETLGSAYQNHSIESFCDYFIKEKDNIVQLGVISIVDTSNKSLVSQLKEKSRIPRSNILSTTTRKTRVPNPLLLLMVTKKKNTKVRRLIDIATFVGNMVMWSLNVLKDGSLRSSNEE